MGPLGCAREPISPAPAADMSQSIVLTFIRAEPAGLLKGSAQLAEEYSGHAHPGAMLGRVDETKSVWLGFYQGHGRSG